MKFANVLINILILFFFNFCPIHAQIEQKTVPIPQSLPQEHPRYMTTPKGKVETLKLIEKEAWAKDIFEKLKRRTDIYVQRTEEQSDWLLSRLAMYWKTHATNVYIKSETFDHTGGPKAPVPTVRYTGTRGTMATYGRPKLENIIPYDDDENGNVTFCNNSLPGHPQEKVHPSKTGRNIENINCEIIGIARDAAFLYWLTGDERYARLASGVFDTYMSGIYYRNIPIDLEHGHQQTLVGMTSFEVIHEDALNIVVPLYDFLYEYLFRHYKDKMPVYAEAFKKWADNIIDNGVPHNNWNLIQARYIMNVGIILEDNSQYLDHKGRQYYIDYVMNHSGIRQWSLTRLADYGFDPNTGIWAECPGYSNVVLNDYADFTNLFDNNLHYDLVKAMPVLPKAVTADLQYLFPNRMICGFGDTHPGYLKPNLFIRMIQNAQSNRKEEQENYFTALLKCLNPEAGSPTAQSTNIPVSVSSFFNNKPLELKQKIKPGHIEDYVSPIFYAPNVSWLVQRNGMNLRHSLMISQNASLGNHMHANGISMELYGKGYVLGPDAGIGLHLYSGMDYAEYYSQFPSHNTVCVDGISSYPVMKSNHAFQLKSCFPLPSAPGNPFSPISYSEVNFREPESRADQSRLMSIVTTGDETGYYVDIFRSRKEYGGDKMHDYFYHNLGQTLSLTGTDDSDLNLQPTEELAFAGAHLYAYSYLYNKKMAPTDKDIKATFTIKMKDDDDIYMNLWMKGDSNRQVFTALAPMTEGLSRTPEMPYDIKKQPTQTFIARQHGEAWCHPFVAIYEPSSAKEPSCISQVSFPKANGKKGDSNTAIRIEQKNGRIDIILSSDNPANKCISGNMNMRGTYALWGKNKNGTITLLLGNGTRLITPDVAIEATTPISILLEYKSETWYYTATGKALVNIKGIRYSTKKTNTPERLF